MSSNKPTPTRDIDRDLIDEIPGYERFATNLQRSVGPSCLLSLIISVLIIITLRRYVRLPLPGMVFLTLVVWWAVLVILVRLSRGPDEELEE